MTEPWEKAADDHATKAREWATTAEGAVDRNEGHQAEVLAQLSQAHSLASIATVLASGEIGAQVITHRGN